MVRKLLQARPCPPLACSNHFCRGRIPFIPWEGLRSQESEQGGQGTSQGQLSLISQEVGDSQGEHSFLGLRILSGFQNPEQVSRSHIDIPMASILRNFESYSHPSLWRNSIKFGKLPP